MRLISAKEAIQAFEDEQRNAGLDLAMRDLLALAATTSGEAGSGPALERALSVTQVMQLWRMQKDEQALIKKRHRLLMRYLAEAQSRRRRAFSAWVGR